MATTSFDEETSQKVIRQVEFYFSDSNLPRDKFLKKTINEGEDRMVSLALICSFSRMRNHLGLGDVKADGVPEDTVKAVADTLRSSDFLKISEDGKKVGRRTELKKPEEIIEQLDSRTVAASPLPYDVKLEDVESFFTQITKVNSVRLPRHVSNKNLFCGTALVEFSSEEDADNVLKQTLTYAGVNLVLKPKRDFDAEREKQTQEYEKSAQGHGKSNDSEEANYPKGLIIAFALKSKSSEGSLEQNGSHEHVSEAEASKTDEGQSVANASEEADKTSENDKNGAIEDVEENKEKVPHESEEFEKSSEGSDEKDGEKAVPEGKPSNTVDSYKDNMNVVIREDLRAVFEKFGTVKYIDFKMGEHSGYIRFEEPEAAQKARAAAVLAEEGGLLVKNYVATLEPVTGEAEKGYWSQIQGSQGRFRDRGHKGRGGKYNRGGRRGRRSRENDSSTGRPNKVQKVAT